MRYKTFFEYPVFDNVRDVINHSVKKYPQNIAFKIKEEKDKETKYIDITYEKFLEEVNNFGTGLYELRFARQKNCNTCKKQI